MKENNTIYYKENKCLIKYQIIEEDVSSQGVVVWYIETYFISDSNGNYWLEEVEYNKNCIYENNFIKKESLVKLKEES